MRLGGCLDSQRRRRRCIGRRRRVTDNVVVGGEVEGRGVGAAANASPHEKAPRRRPDCPLQPFGDVFGRKRLDRRGENLEERPGDEVHDEDLRLGLHRSVLKTNGVENGDPARRHIRSAWLDASRVARRGLAGGDLSNAHAGVYAVGADGKVVGEVVGHQVEPSRGKEVGEVGHYHDEMRQARKDLKSRRIEPNASADRWSLFQLTYVCYTTQITTQNLTQNTNN